jgi:hypothetical protein
MFSGRDIEGIRPEQTSDFLFEFSNILSFEGTLKHSSCE